MAETVIEEEKALWVLVRLMDSICAVDGTSVEAILEQEHELIRMPGGDDVHIGMISFRGGFVPVTDLRRLMGMDSQRQEQDAFEQMLEQRKQDHIHWVDELKRSLAAEEPFTLATDPHKCAFGKWYDGFHSVDYAISSQLEKIDVPHRALHQSAVDAIACKRECNDCKRELCVRKATDRAANEYMPTVVRLLEEAKEIFRNSYRRMMVVLTQGERRCAILVDEVLAAETLPSMKESRPLGSSEENPMVTHIAQREQDNHQILILNQTRLFAPVV